MRKQTNDKGHKVSWPPALQSGPVIILVRPQLGENIGTAARAMANFSLVNLRIIMPRDGWPNDDAVSASAGADRVIENARIYESTGEAVADLNFVCATTARPRDMIKPVLAPEHAMSEIGTRVNAGQKCGILFGAEKSGLTNDDIALADTIVTAPVDPSFASLNLAQSVLLVAYEWLKQSNHAGLGRQTEFDGPVHEGVQMQRTRPATRAELVGFFEHLENELDASGFLRPPEKRPVMVRNIRNLFHRMGTTEQEVRTLRGIVSSLVKGEKRRDDMS